MADRLRRRQERRILQLEEENARLREQVAGASSADAAPASRLACPDGAGEGSARNEGGSGTAAVPGDLRSMDPVAVALFRLCESQGASARLRLWQVAAGQRLRLAQEAGERQDCGERRRSEAVVAVRLAAQLTDGPLSKQAYERVRDANPELRLMASATAERRCGGWAVALDLAGLAPAPAAIAVRPQNGPFFSIEELGDLLRAAAAATGPAGLRRVDFRRWLEKEASNEDSRFPRLPAPSSDVFHRHGGFVACCKASGVPAARAAAGPVTREGLEAVLRAAAASNPGRPLTFPDYRAWADRERARPDSEHPAVPIVRQPFIGEFGGWCAACEAAGIPAPRGGRARELYGREKLIDELRAAADYLHPDRKPDERFITQAAYERYRRSRPGPVVSIAAITAEFGTWASAQVAAGVTTEKAAAGYRRPVRTEDEILDAFALVARELRVAGQSVNSYTYRRWVAQKRNTPRHPDRTFPSHFTIAQRLGNGNFEAAARRAELSISDIEDQNRHGSCPETLPAHHHQRFTSIVAERRS